MDKIQTNLNTGGSRVNFRTLQASCDADVDVVIIIVKTGRMGSAQFSVLVQVVTISTIYKESTRDFGTPSPCECCQLSRLSLGMLQMKKRNFVLRISNWIWLI